MQQRLLESTFGLLLAIALGGCSATPSAVRVIDARATALSSQIDVEPAQVKASQERGPAADRLAKSDAATRPIELPSEHGGAECLAELRSSGVAFVPLDSLRGVETPVEVRGPIGPVTFWVNGNGPLQLDCRLALTLRRLGPVFEAQQVTRARFSGAYVFRNTRGGRLSHHAHGLALDIHEVVLGGQQLSVKRDFMRQAQCTSEAPALNRLACALRESGVFEELLTPDFNSDHHDHLHVSVRRGPATLAALAAAREQELIRAAAERKAAQAQLAARSRELASTPALPAAPLVPTAPLEAAKPTPARTTSKASTAGPQGDVTPAPETAPEHEAADESEAAPPPPPPLPPAPQVSPEAGSGDERGAQP